MKNGTLYGTKVKKAYAKLRHALPSPRIPDPDLGIIVEARHVP